MEQNYNKSLFCANCQMDVMHTGTVDANGDIVFTCSTPECGRFLKLPSPQQLEGVTYEDLIADHKAANEGQVSLMGSIDALAALTEPQSNVNTEQTLSTEDAEASVVPSDVSAEESAPSTDTAEATVTSEDTTVTSEAPADQVAPTDPTVQEAEIVTDPTI